MDAAVIYDFTVPMALVDFVPVLLFAAAGVYLMLDLYYLMSKGAYALLCGGCIMVFFAGFSKALWKLLYAANVCDFAVLNQMFFPVQSVGFMMLGVSLVCLMLLRQSSTPTNLALAAAPAVYKGTMLFVCFMILGCAGMYISLSALAAKLKRKLAAVLFILALVLMLGMGYLSSRDSSSAAINWIDQGLNTLGQLCLLVSVIDLHKHGIRELKAVRA